MEFDYDSLRVLEAVVRTGSFEHAAKLLNVTQSAVSQRIKQLEERVGSLLIVRGRPCVPTEDGLLLCQHIDQVTLLQHELRDRMGGPMGGARAINLRIAVNNDSLATWFARVLKRAGDELNLRLEVIPDDQDFTEERLRSGDALAVITTNQHAIPGCHIQPLGLMEYIGVASPSFVEQHLTRGGITLATIAAAPAISFDQKDTLPEQWLKTAFGSVMPISAHRVPSYEGHMQCALAGVGWAIMPVMSVFDLIKEGKLVDLVPGSRVALSLQWQYRTQSSTILVRLSEIVAEVAAQELAPQ